MAQEKGREGKGDSPKGKDSEYEFIPPDFDEDAFIHKEMVSYRTTLILFLWGIVAAAVSWAAFAALGGAKVGWLVGLLLMAAFGAALKWLFPRLKADIRHFGKREWLGTAALFFFTWLSFFIIAINPPVSDFAPPRVGLHAAPVVQASGGSVAVHLFVEDNVAVSSHTFTLSQGGRPIATQGDLRSLGRGHYVYEASGLAPGLYRLEATATDARGHQGSGSLDFAVSEGLVDYSATGGGVLTGAADRVLVKTPDVPACKTRRGTVSTSDPCVRTVRLEAQGGGSVTLKWDKDEQAWTATTAHAGWRPGNNTFDVVAEMADQYDGSVRFDGGALRDGPHTVDVRATPGSEAVEPAADPPAPRRSVPGPGLPLLALGLLAALAAAARRR